MVNTTIVSQQDGPRIQVATLMKSPTAIPKRILTMMNQSFLVDAILRGAGDAPSGTVLYWQSTPLFANEDPAILDEFGEIPTTNGSLGTPLVARVVRRALALRVSKQMVDRNSVDAVNTQVVQIKNTMVRAWEDALFSAMIANGQVQVMTTDKAWGATGSHIRQDINAAKFLVKNAAADAAGKQKFGYVADTLLISTQTETDFLDSNEVSLPYVGNLASENLLYTGKLPNKFLGLDVLVSWRLSAYAPSAAVVCQRKVMGGIADERPLQGTPMYPEGGGGNGGPTESFRTDITRASAIFFDQPKAVVIIAGVTGGTNSTTLGGRTFTLGAGTAEGQPGTTGGNTIQ